MVGYTYATAEAAVAYTAVFVDSVVVNIVADAAVVVRSFGNLCSTAVPFAVNCKDPYLLW